MRLTILIWDNWKWDWLDGPSGDRRRGNSSATASSNHLYVCCAKRIDIIFLQCMSVTGPTYQLAVMEVGKNGLRASNTEIMSLIYYLIV